MVRVRREARRRPDRKLGDGVAQGPVDIEKALLLQPHEVSKPRRLE
jgi:hypothetical protein